MPPLFPAEPGLQADQRLLDRGWLRIGAGLAIAAQAMVFSLAINLSEVEGWAYPIVHGILIVAAIASLVFLGGDLVRSALEAVRERRISIDLLFLVTLGGALGGSLVSTFTRTGSVYYEVVAILIVVHTTGKMLGARSRLAALRAVDDTRETFEYCDVVGDGDRLVRARVSELPPGAPVRIAPGGAIAVDGSILSGRGYVQETSMTGEWRPVPRGPGETVYAGTFSIDGSFDVSATGGPRRLDVILDTVMKARLQPSRLQQQADQLMRWFLPLVIAVSAGTFAGWWLHGPWEKALFNAMAVLLVACPCAMGLATPVAVWGGLARLARIGLVARTGDVLDALARVDFLCIDKTGTLSEQVLAVKVWQTEPSFAGREAWLQTAVATVEQGLAHPVAAALLEKCHVLRDTFPGTLTLKSRTIVPGRGVVAEIEDEAGKIVSIAIGEADLGAPETDSPRAATAVAVEYVDRVKCHVIRDTFYGREVHVFVEGVRAATVELGERWREGMDAVFGELRSAGVEIEVLSGDSAAARALPAEMSVHAGLTPAAKLARVEEHVAAGRTVVFVGDGLNDAAAMSAAHASIAMGGGAALARASAMAVFVGEELGFLSEAIGVARAVRRSVHSNLLFAAMYNLTGMALAAAGVLHPVAAALLMVGSSVFVSIRSLRSVNRRLALEAAGSLEARRSS